jgi:hypothetical protein
MGIKTGNKNNTSAKKKEIQVMYKPACKDSRPISHNKPSKRKRKARNKCAQLGPNFITFKTSATNIPVKATKNNYNSKEPTNKKNAIQSISKRSNPKKLENNKINIPHQKLTT